MTQINQVKTDFTVREPIPLYFACQYSLREQRFSQPLTVGEFLTVAGRQGFPHGEGSDKHAIVHFSEGDTR